MSEKPSPELELATPANRVLNVVSKEVPPETILSSEIQSLLDQMKRIAQGEQGDVEHKTMVGLAAPQLGLSKRIILVGVDSDGLGGKSKLQIYINPEIAESSKKSVIGREGCYSTGNVCGIVDRAQSVTVKGFNRKGEPVVETHTGFPARVFQHEIDHLDGIRFPDRITDDSKLHWVEQEQFGEYRKRWQEWENLCSREDWLSIKAGKSN